jgi:hypothetical protein
MNDNIIFISCIGCNGFGKVKIANDGDDSIFINCSYCNGVGVMKIDLSLKEKEET